MYRFRSTKFLLHHKFNELKDQVIFFSELSKLNDPMEGNYNFYWQGDKILWKNFFQSYLFSLTFCLGIVGLLPYRCKCSDELTNIIKFRDNFEDTPLYKRFKQISKSFILQPDIIHMLKYLSSHSEPFNKKNIEFFLNLIHPFAFESVINNEISNNLLPLKKHQSFISSKIGIFGIKTLKKCISKNVPVFNIFIHFYINILNIILRFETFKIQFYKQLFFNKNAKFISRNFVSFFILQLRRITFPDYYVACFTKTCENENMWKKYADKHKGVCLKFSTKKSDMFEFINLKTITGFTYDLSENKQVFTKEFQKYTFTKVKYSKKLCPILFFDSIGLLNKKSLADHWYCGFDGNNSNNARFSKDSHKDEIWRIWRKKYIDCFLDFINTKGFKWRDEEEYRVAIYSNFESFVPAENRKLKYRFEDLDAIIFGIKTPEYEKKEIISIIQQKCIDYKRMSFSFYQAKYSKNHKTIEIHLYKELVNCKP